MAEQATVSRSSYFSQYEYNIDQYKYPIDLATNPDQSSYAIFYINVYEGSQVLQTEGTVGVVNRGGQNRLEGEVDVGNEIGASSSQIKRLQSAIALYMTPTLVANYRVNYEEDDSMITSSIADAANTSFSDAVKKLGSTAKAMYQNQQGSGAVAGTAGAVGTTAKRLARNPRKEQVFKGVDFRRFTFDYVFAPRSPEEASNVKNIIQLFKYHMHPEFLVGSFVYLAPSEFDIQFYEAGSENENLHKISSCVLTDMSVNYAPNGSWSKLAQTGGFPTQINMSLTFLELENMTKERIYQGF